MANSMFNKTQSTASPGQSGDVRRLSRQLDQANATIEVLQARLAERDELLDLLDPRGELRYAWYTCQPFYGSVA